MTGHIEGKYHLHNHTIYCSFPFPIAGVALKTDNVTSLIEIGLKCNSAILNGHIASLCKNY